MEEELTRPHDVALDYAARQEAAEAHWARRTLFGWHVGACVAQGVSLVAQIVVWAVLGAKFFPFSVCVPRGRGAYFAAPAEYPAVALIVAFTALTALSHFWQARLARYVPAFAQRVLAHGSRANGVRWLEYSVTAGLMTFAIAQLAGVRDLPTLLVLVLLNVVMQGLGYVHEAANTAQDTTGEARFRRPFWYAYALAWVAFAATWLVIIWSFVLSVSSLGAGETLPWFVWVVFFTLLFFYAQFGLLMGLHSARDGCCRVSCGRRCGFSWQSRRTNEIAYIVLSLSAKLALEWIVLGGLIDFAGSGADARRTFFATSCSL